MHRVSVRQILLPFDQQLPDLILVPDSIHDWREGDLALNPGVASEKHNVLQDFHFPCSYLSFSLSLSLSLSNALFGCWEMKGKKWFFYLMCLLLQRKWKEREGKSDFWTFLFLFFEVDNFNFFSFFLWLSVWLPSKTEGIEGKEEMKGILWPLVCLRLCFVAEKKKEKKKVIFFLSLWFCLVAEKWILGRENERKEQVKRKRFLNFLIFFKKVFNKLFIYLGHIRLNRRVTN